MLACVFNVMPHYRKEIYQLLDSELACDFYAGDKIPLPLKKLNPKQLKGFKYLFNNFYIYKNIYWQIGIHKIFNKKYDSYLLTGDPYCISSWAVLLYGKIFSKNVFIWAHGLNGHEGKLKLLFKKLFFKLAHKTFVYSDLSTNFMLSLGFDKSKVIPIYNSLGYTDQRNVRESITKENSIDKIFDNNAPYLIYVGRIQEGEKKLYLILEAIQLLKKEGVTVNLLLVGRIIQDKILRELIKKYNLEKQVNFYGPLFDENMLGKLFYNASSCVCPGNIGLTAVHSLNYGCPVITHDKFTVQMPEYEAITKGVTGDFFEYNNIKELKNSIKEWINIDDSTRENTRNKCYQMIDERYNPFYQLEILKQHLLTK